MALVPSEYRGRYARSLLLGIGLFGAALLYGDGMITPAISVLGAVEGLGVVTPLFTPYIVPGTLVILLLLFAVQVRGTGRVGAWFGPVMVVWFGTLGALGVANLAVHPSTLAVINPMHVVRFFGNEGYHAFVVLGSVFLVVTGGEALYADMGHFGKRPIRLAWFFIAQPALALNYFGQGALLLERPGAASSPFYLMAPPALLVPLVALATAAAIIASQALISAVFSLTRQAVQLGYSPRVEVAHTSAQEAGQIYIPPINWALMLATMALVVAFGSSGALAAAYGIAVTLTMVITTVLAYVVARHVWGWSRLAVSSVAAVFLAIDLAFFGSNTLKILHGGWVPLVIAWVIFTVLSTWKTGRALLGTRLRERAYPFDRFLHDIDARPPQIVPGTAVFMTGLGTATPAALMHNVRHNHVLHEQVILLTVVTADTPHVPVDRRCRLEPLGRNFVRVWLDYGFMEEPDVPAALAEAASRHGLRLDLATTTYFLGRETLLATKRPGMAQWREKLFVLMSKNATSPTAFFRLPPDRVVELGMQVEL